MNITALITGIEYKSFFGKELRKIEFKEFDINSAPASCAIIDKNIYFAISKWVSPKRTRSYPFERVYNTLSISKKITVIPVIKDEGFEGDRDFIQWDTVSLMSLLDVYVIFAYYHKAEKHKSRYDKITKQQFDNAYIIDKIKEISNYHSSALHWNLKEINSNLAILIDKIKYSYQHISKKTGVKFHSSKGLDDFKKQFEEDVKVFMNTSRIKAEAAAKREQKTLQPKEMLQTLTKATITIKNYLGGLYFLTTDEILIEDKIISLIESKHSNSSLLPSKNDIKDALLKMILYCNLSEIKIENNTYKSKPVLSLTSCKILGKLNSDAKVNDLNNFFKNNRFNESKKNTVQKLFEEAKTNGFYITIQRG
ncbi:MAG: hypothetical protein KA792_03445 [Bacteroidales bacterium]|nr:hypothetical protein [Bacteroidales bacterium]